MANEENRDRIRKKRAEARRERNRILREQKEKLKQEQAEDLITFFTQGPEIHEDILEVISNDPQVRELFWSSLSEVSRILKAVITSYEDFFEAKMESFFEDSAFVAETRQRLDAALHQLNRISTSRADYALTLDENWDPVGSVSYDLRSEYIDDKAIKYFGDKHLARLAIQRIENFKKGLVEWQEDFPVGVCRYEHCATFFIKRRRDQRFCSSNHATYARIQRQRKTP